MNQIRTNNPLLSIYDKDPGRWRPYKYGTLIDVPVTVNGSAENTIQILNQPFIMDRISAEIVGPVWDPDASGLANDGQYFVEWHEEQSVYQSAPLLAAAAYGTEEFPLYLSAPIAFAGNKSLTFRVTNAYTRVLTPVAETFQVQIILHGISDWGTLT